MTISGGMDLQRFVDAQGGGVYEQALAEIEGGRKTSHWMWFVFPQLVGLGHSPTAQHFGISGLAEARAYLAHPVLGDRLRTCAAAVTAARRTAEQVFGPLDAMKLRSSATLFHRAAPEEPVFAVVLEHCFDGVPDEHTDRLLAERS
jgi:uncharacterized protein (DUF1810 family)